MKKIILSLLIMLSFSGCTGKVYTPVICTSFETNAVYQAGDFSYTCKIKKTDKSVCVTVLSTSAKGMTIRYDGANVEFRRRDMVKEIDGDAICKTNPAIIIYQVFQSLNNIENVDVKKLEEGYQYTGKISIGDYVLLQDNDDKFRCIEIPIWNIKVTFTD